MRRIPAQTSFWFRGCAHEALAGKAPPKPTKGDVTRGKGGLRFRFPVGGRLTKISIHQSFSEIRPTPSHTATLVLLIGISTHSPKWLYGIVRPFQLAEQTSTMLCSILSVLPYHSSATLFRSVSTTYFIDVHEVV